jgi:hypothetical protein
VGNFRRELHRVFLIVHLRIDRLVLQETENHISQLQYVQCGIAALLNRARLFQGLMMALGLQVSGRPGVLELWALLPRYGVDDCLYIYTLAHIYSGTYIQWHIYTLASGNCSGSGRRCICLTCVKFFQLGDLT